MKTLKKIKLIAFLIIVQFIITDKYLDHYFMASCNTLTLKVKTYDGLELPAQVINNNSHDKKMILFINGSTPYDEKGNLGAFWNDKGKIIMERHDFYLRFLDIISNKGYSIATMAKRIKGVK